MINILQKFANFHNLNFSTDKNPVKSKTKCIHFSNKKVELAKIFLNADHLPWVDSAKHVGNTLQRDNSCTMDIRNKRGCFIGRVLSILQEVHFANPVVKMEMINMYASSFYCSPLRKLFDGPCDRIYSAWNNAIREAFNIPRTSHRYFIEEVSEHLHPMVMLSSSFVKFHQTLQKSSRFRCTSSGDANPRPNSWIYS